MILEEFFKNREIWVYNGQVDFRKQMNGLITLVMEEMGSRPTDGNMYVFRNRQRDKLKIVMWDRNGFVLGYKRLEKGRFDFPETEKKSVVITAKELFMMISGMPMLYVGKEAEKELRFS